jgi:hypothetical protein
MEVVMNKPPTEPEAVEVEAPEAKPSEEPQPKAEFYQLRCTDTPPEGS